MKYTGILLTVLAIGLGACRNDGAGDVADAPSGREKIFSQLYNSSQLESDVFEVNAQRDTTLYTKNGTTIKLYANSFITLDSAAVSGMVSLEIKEAFTPLEFVLGNLVTKSNDINLMSGGMVYIDATATGRQLLLKEESEIGFFVPTDSLDRRMLVYEGQRDGSDMINWDSPKRMLNSTLESLEHAYITITYRYHGDFNKNDITFNNWLWEVDRKVGDKTIVEGVNVTVIDIAKDFVSLRENADGLFIPDVITNKGRNGFVEDYNTSYIFSVKKLGWANIDRLFDDPKAEQVRMLATIGNQSEFDYVFTSLLLPEQSMYIPGYQKKDNSFGFTHYDSEPLVLPVGSKATIMATAYKDDRPYFKLETITIGHDMNVAFNLEETTAEGLRKALEESI